MYLPAYANEARVTAFLDEILAARPAQIVDTHNPATPFLTFPVDTPEIRERLARLTGGYHLASDAPYWTVYMPTDALAVMP